jgi:hypothetical protein
MDINAMAFSVTLGSISPMKRVVYFILIVVAACSKKEKVTEQFDWSLLDGNWKSDYQTLSFWDTLSNNPILHYSELLPYSAKNDSVVWSTSESTIGSDKIYGKVIKLENDSLVFMIDTAIFRFHKIIPKPSQLSRLEEIQYSVGPCFGPCPVFDISIDSNGKIRFRGNLHVNNKGDHEGSIDKIALNYLFRFIESYDFETLKNFEMKTFTEDNPIYSLYLRLSDGSEITLQGSVPDHFPGITQRIESLSKYCVLHQTDTTNDFKVNWSKDRR